ncbi:MAG: hypothetical protein GXP42_13605 [Chloroflexi bacterium]|nr:hypothetical protein [Chloroflexota bacterium]
MRRFNRGYALGFLLIIIVSILAIRWSYARVEGRYQARVNELAQYTLDDWLEVLRLEEWLGEPEVTPIPVEQILGTPTPQAEPEAKSGAPRTWDATQNAQT